MKRKLFLLLCALLTSVGMWAQSWSGNAPAANGTFYLYNVGAAKFLNNGDPNQGWGTNAYLQAGFGMDIKFEANGSNFNLNTNVSNGGNNHYLATSTWCDGAATAWTFTAVAGQANTYTIGNGTSYLVANDALNDVEFKASTGDNKSWWKLVSLDDFKAAMTAKEYSSSDPMDVSVFIKGRSFARNDGRNSTWTTSHNGGNWDWIGGVEDKYYGNEAWNNTFDVHQEITGLPEGTYELKCSGFGTNGTTYIYATTGGTTTQKAIQSDNTTSRGTSKGDKWKAIQLDNAFSGQTTGTFVVGTIGNKNATIGLKRETNQSYDWCIYDEFRLYYYGLDLSKFVSAYNDAKSGAKAIQDEAMYSSVKTTLQEAISTYETIDETSLTELQEATRVLTEATSAANASIAAYATLATALNTYSNKAASLDDAGQAAYNVNTIQTAYENGTYTNDQAVAAVNNVAAAFVTAVKAQTTIGSDWTGAISNPNFETNDLSAWDFHGKSQPNAVSTTYKDCEFFNLEFDMTQTLTGMKKGTYEISFQAFQRPGAADQALVTAYKDGSWTSVAQLYTTAEESDVMHILTGASTTKYNNNSKQLTMDESTIYIPDGMEGARAWFNHVDGESRPLYQATARAIVSEDNGELSFGFKGDVRNDSKWIIFSNFQLKYIDTEVMIAVTEAERVLGIANEIKDSKMNADVKTNLVTAINNLQTDVDEAKAEESDYVGGANYNAILTATSNANASIDIYEVITASYEEYTNLAEANLTSVGQTAFENSEAVANYEANEYVDSETAIAAFKAAYIDALKAYSINNTELTVVINDPSFESGNLTAWNNTNTTFSIKSDNQLSNKEGTYYAYAASNRTQGVNQTISGLQSGYYVVSVNAYAKDITRTSTLTTSPGALTIGNLESSIPNNATGIYKAAYQVVSDNSDVNIGVAGAGKKEDNVIVSRFYVDNFTLKYYTTLPDVDVSALAAKPMKASVLSALNSASETYASSKAAADYNALQNAILDAEASANIYSVYAVYEAKAVASLTTAALANFHNDATVAEYYNGTYAGTETNEAAIKAAYINALKSEGAGSDWTSLLANPSFEEGTSGWSAQYSATAERSWSSVTEGEPTDGTHALKKRTANGWFTGFAVDQAVTLPVGYYRLTADVKSTNVSVNTYIFASTNTTWSGKDMTTLATANVEEANNWESLEAIFYVDAEKTVYLGVTTEGPNNSGGTYADYYADNFHLTYLGNTTANMAVNAEAKWGTFCAPFEVAIPDGVDAYTCADATNGVLNLVEVNTTIPANTPVILNAESGLASTTFYGVKVANESEDLIAGGLLRGNVSNSAKDIDYTGNEYLLQRKNDKTGFYKMNDANTYKVGYNRCYLVMDSNQGGNAREVFFFEDDATAISALEAAKAETGALKDGKYLIDGKIVLVKNGVKYDANGKKLN